MQSWVSDVSRSNHMCKKMPEVASSPGFLLIFFFGFILNELLDLLFGFVDVLATVKDHFNHLKYLVELFICHDFCLHSYPLLPHTLPYGYIVTKSRMRFKSGVSKTHACASRFT